MTDAVLRQQAHTLIDAITPAQLSAVVGLLEVIAPPTPESAAAIPYEDELISDEEDAQAAVGAKGPWTPIDQVMLQLNITQDDLDEQRLRDEALVSR